MSDPRPISGLAPGFIEESIHVKVLHKWIQKDYHRIPTVMLLLCDIDGSKILMTIPKELQALYSRMFSKNQWRSISLFIVKHLENEAYSETKHPYESSVTEHTIVLHLVDLSNKSFLDLESIESIKKGDLDKRYPVDVIGRVSKGGDLNYHDHRPEHIRSTDWCLYNFDIEEEEGHKIECLAFGDYAVQIYYAYKKRDQNRPFVVVLRQWHINTLNDPISIQTFGMSSEILINPDFVEVEEFLNKIVVRLSDDEGDD